MWSRIINEKCRLGGLFVQSPQPVGSKVTPELCTALFCLGELIKTADIVAKDGQVNKWKGCKIGAFVTQTPLPFSL